MSTIIQMPAKTSSLKTFSPKTFLLWGLLLLIFAVGCTPTVNTADQNANQNADQKTGAKTDKTTSTTPIESTAETISFNPTTLNISADGLQAVNDESELIEAFPFGSDRTQVEETLITVLGEPSDAGNSEACSGSYMSWNNGLSIRLNEGKLSGWDLRNSSVAPKITTAEGIGIGSTLAELDAQYALTFYEESTLGREFSAAGMSGILSDSGERATVENLWNGEACLAR